jgi:hypothetical protein
MVVLPFANYFLVLKIGWTAWLQLSASQVNTTFKAPTGVERKFVLR